MVPTDINTKSLHICQNILQKSGEVLFDTDKNPHTNQRLKNTSIPVFKYGPGKKFEYYMPLLDDDYCLMITDKKMENQMPRFYGKDVEKLVASRRGREDYISIHATIVLVSEIATLFMKKLSRTKYIDHADTDMMQKCIALDTYLDRVLAQSPLQIFTGNPEAFATYQNYMTPNAFACAL